MRSITQRQAKIIQVIVNQYVLDGQPVGSQNLVEQYNLDFSSATVRKEMSVLEQMGLLLSPHTSAGRIPTDEAFQYYISELVNLYKITLSEKVKLEEFYKGVKLQLEQLLKETSILLANISNSVGIALAPISQESMIKRIELVSIQENYILLVMISQANSIFQKKIKLNHSTTQDDLYIVSKFLNQYLQGYEIKDIQDKGLDFLDLNSLDMTENIKNTIIQVSQNLIYNPPEHKIHIYGEKNLYKNLLKYLSSNDLVEKVMEKISNKDFLRELFNYEDKNSNSSDIRSRIGMYIDGEYVSGISILSSSYSIGGKNVGKLGIIGPNRMRYDRLIPTLSYSTTLLSDTLKQKYNITYEKEKENLTLQDIKLLE